MANLPLEAYNELERAAEEAAEREIVIESADDFLSNAKTILISSIADILLIVGVAVLSLWVFKWDVLGMLIGLTIFFFARPFFRRFSKNKVLYANELGDYFVGSQGWLGIIIGIALLWGAVYGIDWLLKKWLPSYAFFPTMVGYTIIGAIVLPPIIGDIRNILLSSKVLRRFTKNGIITKNDESREFVIKEFERQNKQNAVVILLVIAFLIIGAGAQWIQVKSETRYAKECFDRYAIKVVSYTGEYELTEEDLKNSEGGSFGRFNETYTDVYNFTAVEGEKTYKISMTATYKYDPYKREWRLSSQGENPTLIAMNISGTWQGKGNEFVLLGDAERDIVIRFDSFTMEEAVGYYSVSSKEGLIHESTFAGEVVSREENVFELHVKFDDPVTAILNEKTGLNIYYDIKTDIVTCLQYGGEYTRNTFEGK